MTGFLDLFEDRYFDKKWFHNTLPLRLSEGGQVFLPSFNEDAQLVAFELINIPTCSIIELFVFAGFFFFPIKLTSLDVGAFFPLIAHSCDLDASTTLNAKIIAFVVCVARNLEGVFFRGVYTLLSDHLMTNLFLIICSFNFK